MKSKGETDIKRTRNELCFLPRADMRRAESGVRARRFLRSSFDVERSKSIQPSA